MYTHGESTTAKVTDSLLFFQLRAVRSSMHVKRWWVCLVAASLCLATGCGGERDKGINKDADRPKAVSSK
jgi:hypothetical protein